MTKIPTKEQNPKGLHQKYYLSKIDGSPIDDDAEYFILRLDNGGDKEHVKACRTAIVSYALAIATEIPKLALDLLKRYAPNDTESVFLVKELVKMEESKKKYE